eukprot:Rhum_TRINITY_DN14427_c10_g3::Rhum_TRINITY_DN14427_c10_g3_i1::g.89890::m.89890
MRGCGRTYTSPHIVLSLFLFFGLFELFFLFSFFALGLFSSIRVLHFRGGTCLPSHLDGQMRASGHHDQVRHDKVGEWGAPLRLQMSVEERMLQCLSRRHTLLRVKLKHPAQQVDAQRVHVRELRLQVLRPPLRELPLEVRQLRDARPRLLVGRPAQAEDREQHGEVARVVDVCEDGTRARHLGEDGADAPHVDHRRVAAGTQQQVRRPVEQRGHDRRALVPLQRVLHEPRQPEVRDLELAPVARHQDVRRLQVAVDDALVVAVLQAREEHMQEGRDVQRRQQLPVTAAAKAEVLTEVRRHELEHQREVVLLAHNVLAVHDVRVLQLLQGSYLPQEALARPRLPVQVLQPLQRHAFAGERVVRREHRRVRALPEFDCLEVAHGQQHLAVGRQAALVHVLLVHGTHAADGKGERLVDAEALRQALAESRHGVRRVHAEVVGLHLGEHQEERDLGRGGCGCCPGGGGGCPLLLFRGGGSGGGNGEEGKLLLDLLRRGGGGGGGVAGQRRRLRRRRRLLRQRGRGRDGRHLGGVLHPVGRGAGAQNKERGAVLFFSVLFFFVEAGRRTLACGGRGEGGSSEVFFFWKRGGVGAICVREQCDSMKYRYC